MLSYLATKQNYMIASCPVTLPPVSTAQRASGSHSQSGHLEGIKISWTWQELIHFSFDPLHQIQLKSVQKCWRWNMTIHMQMQMLTSHNTLLTYYSMEQSPSWEAKCFAASQEIPRILWKRKAHYCIHKCLPPVPILSQLDPVHTPTHYFLKIHLNTIIPSMPGSPKWTLSLRFPNQTPVYASPLPHTCYMPRPPHSSRFYHLNNNGWGVQIIKLLIM